MKATVIKAFDGARDGSMYPTHWRPGDAIDGDLARVAVREGWATEGAIESTEGGDTHSPVASALRGPATPTPGPRPTSRPRSPSAPKADA